MINLDIGSSAGSYKEYVELLMNILSYLVVAGSIFRSMVAGLSYLSNDQTLNELLKKVKGIVIAAILCGSVPQIIRIIAAAYGGA